MLHIAWSFKALLIFYYSLYNTISDLVLEILLTEAKGYAKEWRQTESTDCFENPQVIIADPENYLSCTAGEGEMLRMCPLVGTGTAVVTALRALIIASLVYAICILAFILYKSPSFGTLQYYVYVVMSKKQRFFRIFVIVNYILLALILAIIIVALSIIA